MNPKDLLCSLVPGTDGPIEVAGDDSVRTGREERIDPRVERIMGERSCVGMIVKLIGWDHDGVWIAK